MRFKLCDSDVQELAPWNRCALGCADRGKKASQEDQIHVSLDMDAIDPRDAPGVGTQAPGGLNYRESHLLMELIAEHGGAGSVDVVEAGHAAPQVLRLEVLVR